MAGEITLARRSAVARAHDGVPMRATRPTAPTMMFARSYSARPVHPGAEAELELRGGDRLGPTGIVCDLDMGWEPEFMAAVQSACDQQRVRGRNWFTMPPIMLGGETGAGRTFAARRLARSAGVPHIWFDASTRMFEGAPRGPDVHLPIPIPAAMLASGCANPVVTITGVEEASEAMVGLLSRMVDPDTSHRFADDAAEAVFDLGAVTWIVQARADGEIPPALSSRLLRVDMHDAGPDHYPLLVIDVLAEVLDDRGVPMPPGLDLIHLLERACRLRDPSIAELHDWLDGAVGEHIETD